MRMRKIGTFAIAGALAISTSFVVSPAATGSTIKAKTITCYKGTQVKKVTAAKPKCPTGWTTKKPAATTTTGKTAQFNGTFKGSGTLVWSSNDVKVTSMSGTGGSSTLGLTKMTGTGSSNPQASTATIKGSGTFSGSGADTLKFELISPSIATASSESAPADVSVNATAKIVGGTGKYAGATGTLKITGSFSITTTAAGKSETQSFTATVTGTINLK